MRVTVCELPQEPSALAAAWAGLCRHVSRHGSELVLLPEFAMVDAVWEGARFDPARWAEALAQGDTLLERLPKLGAERVVGTRPTSERGRRFNEGFLWSRSGGLEPLRRKYFLPSEPGAWEAAWFDRGDPGFPAYQSGGLRFGLNICTELWAFESCAAYSARGVQVILSPRATAATTTAKWLAAGVVAAVRSGAFSLSSNRVDPTGAGGGSGWIIGPDGDVLGRTSPEAPWVTMDIDLASQAAGRHGYPRYVFGPMAGLSSVAARAGHGEARVGRINAP
jgi:N-carbamoylputrescine amidase